MEPIRLEFFVDCAPDHAFEVWTNRAATWWPRSHTRSGDPDLTVVFEPGVGGRVYERAGDGTEYEWGEVTVWDPPHRLDYLWHLFFDRSEATDLSVRFEPLPAGGTRVTLTQDGFDRLPDDVGPVRRERTEGAWAEISALYQQGVEAN